MHDRDLVVALERYSPPALDVPPAWDDVLERAGVAVAASRPRGTRRRLGLALAAIGAACIVAVTTPVGSAIARTFDGFSAWLAGKPGTPATPAEQRAFERANDRSWAAFPRGTKLRRLIETRASGSAFTLLGFRSGSSLCLRLVATGPAAGTATSCAPVRSLQEAKEPALVVAADESFGRQTTPPDSRGYVPALASATFGIVSDGVDDVILTGDDGRHSSLVAGNAFLYVADRPKLGVRIRKAEAVARDGSRAALRFSSAPFGILGLEQVPSGRPRGPHGTERTIAGGVGWLERRDPRGGPVPPGLRERLSSHFLAGEIFAREAQPDPGLAAKVVFLAGRADPRRGGPAAGKQVCVYLVSTAMAGGGCSPLAGFLAGRAFANGTSVAAGGDQYAYFSGAVSDGVASLRLFLADGTVDDVPVADNAYVVPVERALFPVRLVAYDAAGRIVGNEVFDDDGMRTRAPRAARTSMRVRLRVVGAHGVTGALSVGDAVGGYRCREFTLASGAGAGGCTAWPYTGPALRALGVLHSGRDLFLSGQVPPRVAAVVLRYADGETARLKSVAGSIAYAVPLGHPRRGGEVVVLSALDASGAVVARHGLRLHH